MIDEGRFYPRKTLSPEERLWLYSQYFDVVEVNSSFYGIPSAATAEAWTARTPPDFLFNVKAYGLLTGHHLDVARLPEALKAMLPKSERPRHTGRVANEALGPDARTWALRELRKALRPLQEANKLGYVLYEMRELEEIARAAGALDGRAERVHLAMNNNRGDWPAINGLQLKEMLLEDWHPPDRAVLIEALEERHAKKRKGRRGGP